MIFRINLMPLGGYSPVITVKEAFISFWWNLNNNLNKIYDHKSISSKT